MLPQRAKPSRHFSNIPLQSLPNPQKQCYKKMTLSPKGFILKKTFFASLVQSQPGFWVQNGYAMCWNKDNAARTGSFLYSQGCSKSLHGPLISPGSLRIQAEANVFFSCLLHKFFQQLWQVLMCLLRCAWFPELIAVWNCLAHCEVIYDKQKIPRTAPFVQELIRVSDRSRSNWNGLIFLCVFGFSHWENHRKFGVMQNS